MLKKLTQYVVEARWSIAFFLLIAFGYALLIENSTAKMTVQGYVIEGWRAVLLMDAIVIAIYCIGVWAGRQWSEHAQIVKFTVALQPGTYKFNEPVTLLKTTRGIFLEGVQFDGPYRFTPPDKGEADIP